MINLFAKKFYEPYITLSLLLTLLSITALWIGGGILIYISFRELLPLYSIGYLIWLVSITMLITLTVSRFRKVSNDVERIAYQGQGLNFAIKEVRSNFQVSIIKLKHSLLEELAPINRPSAIEALRRFSDREDIQTRTAIIGKLSPGLAFNLLMAFPDEGQLEIMLALARTQVISVKQIREINDRMTEALGFGFIDNTGIADGLNLVYDILRIATVEFERNVCDYIENEDKQLAMSIRNRVNAFDELSKYPDSAIQMLLKQLDSEKLARALKGVDQELREKFYSNMSAQAELLLRDEFEFMSDIPLSDILEAQNAIMRIVKRLEEAGEIDRIGAEDRVA